MKKKYLAALLVPALLLGGALTASATGYYEFSSYSGSGSEYDVDSYGNDIYYGSGTDVYKTTVSIGDLSKKDEPKFLANGHVNPNYQARTFTDAENITLSGYNGTLKGGSIGEMWVDANNIYTIATSNDIVAFNKGTGLYNSTLSYNSGLPAGSGWGANTLLSYGDGNWWMADENRRVYSSSDGETWLHEFDWSDMSGNHGDGMEWVDGKIFVSDMTSNYIGMWGYGDNADTTDTESGWNEWGRFVYAELNNTNKPVEGMGFGAFGHFWAGSGSQIYELGGGDLGNYIPDDDNNPTPEPATMFLFGTGLCGLIAARRRKKNA